MVEVRGDEVKEILAKPRTGWGFHEAEGSGLAVQRVPPGVLEALEVHGRRVNDGLVLARCPLVQSNPAGHRRGLDGIELAVVGRERQVEAGSGIAGIGRTWLQGSWSRVSRREVAGPSSARKDGMFEGGEGLRPGLQVGIGLVLRAPGVDAVDAAVLTVPVVPIGVHCPAPSGRCPR